MDPVLVALIILFLVFLVFVLYIVHIRKGKKSASNIPRKFKAFQFDAKFSNYEKSDNVSSPFKEVLEYGGIEVVKEFKDANLIFFTDFSLIDQSLGSVKFNKDTNYIVYGINGSDELANKAIIAKYMKNCNCTPKSFTLDPNGRMDLEKFHKDGNIYILKKNIQRQEGTLITTDFDYIINKAYKEDYVVCQELLQDPFLVNKRKINMRVYMLVTVDNDPRFFIYKNGFMYYTPKFFEKGSLDKDINITTGYIDRKVYDENPLTIQDFIEYLGEAKGDLLIKNIVSSFSQLKSAYSDVLMKRNEKIPGKKFNIYGVDIAPNENLEIDIIEINKGPDLTYKDERDKNVKLTMVFDCFSLMNIVQGGNPDNFFEV